MIYTNDYAPITSTSSIVFRMPKQRPRNPIITAIQDKNYELLELQMQNRETKLSYMLAAIKALKLLYSSSVNPYTKTEKSQAFKILTLLIEKSTDLNCIPFEKEQTNWLKTQFENLTWNIIKTKWMPVGMALRELEISAEEQLCILYQLFPFADFIPRHKLWKLVVTIKHF